MDIKEAIKNALEHYLIHIQMGEHHDWEQKLQCTKDCLSHIENDGLVNKDWLMSKNYFWVEVFQSYSDFLKRQIQGTSPIDSDLPSMQEERRTINKLLAALK